MFGIKNLITNNFLWWFVILAVLTIFCLIIKKIIIKKLEKIVKKTETQLDDFIFAAIKSIHSVYIVILSLEIAGNIVEFDNRYLYYLDRLFIMATIIQVGITGAKIINCWMDRFFKVNEESMIMSSTSIGLFKVLLKTGFLTFIFIIFLHQLGVNITTLIAGLGVGGVAVALALQNILGDLFASLTIILDRPFSVGDFVIVGNISGTIEYVGIKNTRIRSISGEQIIIANSVILKDQVKNYQVMNERRVVLSLGVVYQTSTEKLKLIPSIVKSIVDKVQKARFDRCHFLNFAPSSLDFEVVYWIEDPTYKVYADVAQEINLEILKRFAEENIEFAYPTQMIYMKHS